MRFIGNKTNLLNNISNVIFDNCDGTEQVFCDLFSGTASVSRFFKTKYTIISNDILYFSYILQMGTIENTELPTFDRIRKVLRIENVFEYLESTDITNENFSKFIYNNYSPHDACERMYLTTKNALRIDFIRNKIEEWKNKELIKKNEYFYLLASLIEGVPFVSNITGTYGAYLKQWDKRAFKNFEMIELNIIDNKSNNRCYNRNANELIDEIKGDILYLDPPYNTRQYLSNYHLLETIAKYDNPEIKGKTGVRFYETEKSNYCIKNKVYNELRDLIKKANFKHIIVSYSQDGLLNEEDIKSVLTEYGIKKSYKIYKIPYKQYQNKITKKIDIHYEYLFYISKYER